MPATEATKRKAEHKVSYIYIHAHCIRHQLPVTLPERRLMSKTPTLGHWQEKQEEEEGALCGA